MRRRLLLLVIAALLPLVVAIGALSFVSVSRERASMRAAAIGYSADMLASVDRELRAHSRLLEILARSPALDGDAPLSRFHEAATRFLAQVPGWDRVILANAQGQVINTSVPFGAKLPGLVDPASFHRTIAARKTIVLDLIGPGPLAPRQPPHIVLRTPVSLHGVDHVLTAFVRPDPFARALEETRIKPTWRPFLIDGSNRIISAPRAARSTGQEAGPATTAARAAGMSGVYAGPARKGDSIITAFIKSPETGWSAHIAIPAAEYNEPMRQSIAIIVPMTLLALLLFGFFAYIARRELLSMRAEAEALSQKTRMDALGRMTGGVAHDFNNLLMVVTTAAEMLRKRNPDKGSERFLTAIQSAVERGSRLTRDLMTFARGQGEGRVTVDAGLRLTSIRSMLLQSANEGTTIEFQLPEGERFIQVDLMQFDLSIVNLVANACEAMPDGGKILISVERADYPDRSGRSGLKLSVRDAGIGIPAKDLPHVFEPFFTTKHVARGGGLGLSQVYGFAKAHGGLAEIVSEPGKGATASIYLPEAEAPAVAVAPDPPPAGAGWRADGLEAAVVDDNEDVRVLTGEVLADLGFRVRYASGASEAMALCEDGVDLVVSDIVMPGAMNGVDLARVIRQRWPDMQTILMTGYSDASTEALAAGIRVLRKPFTPAMLLAVISTSRFETSRRWRRTEV